MHSIRRVLVCAIAAAGLVFSQGEIPPKLHGETASGKAIDLPGAASGKITLLIVGFSKTAGERAPDWEKHATAAFGQDPKFAVYSVAMLEGVPGLLRGMVKSSIRNGRPKELRDNMVMSTKGETEWRQFCAVSDDKVPYLMLLDAAGHQRWSGHGLFSESQLAALGAVIQELES